MKSKAEPATTRIKRLLELLSSYSFNLYYNKGKDMVLSDFLSRQKTDDSNPHEIIPISFSLRAVLHENYNRIDDMKEDGKLEADKYLVQTRSQTKSSDVTIPKVHGAGKCLNPHVKPEHQKLVTPPTCQTQPIDKGLPTNIVPPVSKSRNRQGRAGLGRKARVIMPTPIPIHSYTVLSWIKIAHSCLV